MCLMMCDVFLCIFADSVQPGQHEWISAAAQASEIIRTSAQWLPDFQDL
jgi:hypothetical protein